MTSCYSPSVSSNFYLQCLLPALIGSVLTYCILKLRRPRSTAKTEGNSESNKSLRRLSSDDPDPIEHPAVNNKNGTSVMVLSELDGVNEDTTVMMARKFDDLVVSKITSIEECKLLLHRTRAVSALVPRLMVSPDEDSCYEIATRLLVPLFHVDGCSYAMLTDPDHVMIRSLTVIDRHDLENSGVSFNGVVMPLKGMMLGVVAETLQQQYCPKLKESTFEQHKELHRNCGVNSILTTPILGATNNFVGAIILYMKKENAFSEHDRMLIQDIASMLGAILYAKRMRRAADNAHNISKKMLHSMIPSKVIEQIQVFWDENSNEFQSRRSSQRDSFTRGSSSDLSGEDLDSMESSSNMGKERSNERQLLRRSESVAAKLNFLNQINSEDMVSEETNAMALDTPSYADIPLNGALYAENVKDVVIIFVDIVGFSKMSVDMSPVEVMNMLEALFSRFDALCEKHSVEKLETIGDAYICTTNLFDDHHGGDVKRAALSALNMAKDMIYTSNDVRIPVKRKDNRRCSLETLQVRVGIHVGEVTCGVLGERLPKFTVLGHSVNVAARMEQTAEPNKIRASEAFHGLLFDADNDWDDYEVICMKNMGSIGTFTLDPFKYGNARGGYRRSGFLNQ